MHTLTDCWPQVKYTLVDIMSLRPGGKIFLFYGSSLQCTLHTDFIFEVEVVLNYMCMKRGLTVSAGEEQIDYITSTLFYYILRKPLSLDLDFQVKNGQYCR